MINVKSSPLQPGKGRRLGRRFWFLNAILLLLYLWTLRETSSFAVVVRNGACTAEVPGRSLTITCPRQDEVTVALHARPRAGLPGYDLAPLDWLAPPSAWDSVTAYTGADRRLWAEPFTTLGERWTVIRGQWDTVAGELRLRSQEGVLERVSSDPLPPTGLRLVARLRRPAGNAGIVLLEPGTANGLAFVVNAQERLGAWWRWEDGHLTEPLVGLPYQPPLLAQVQSLLQRLLRAHHVALLLLLLAWLLARALFSPRLHLRRGLSLGSRPLLVALCLLAFLLTTSIATDLLQRLPHVQDSVTYLFQAETLARGHLTAPAPPDPDAFAQEFLLVREGRWFGKYPPGYPALLAIGVLSGAPWLVNPWLATLSVALLFALARALYRRSVALLATALAVVSPFFLFLSGSLMAHSAELFWILLLLWLWLRAVKPGVASARRALLGAALALGWLFLTRQITVIGLALPFVAATAPYVLARHRAHVPVARLLRRWWRRTLALALLFLPFVLLLLAYQQAVTGDPFTDPRLLYWEYDTLGFGQEIGEGYNAFDLELTANGALAQLWYTDPTQTPRGHTPARGVYNLEQNWLALERDLFGWLPALTFAFVWLLFLIGPVKAADWLLLLCGGALAATYVFYWADGIAYGPRYLYAALPVFLLLTARGILVTARWLGGRAGRRALGLLLFLFVGGAVLLNGPAYVQTYRGYNFVDRSDLDLVAANTIPPALVFVDAAADWWHYGSVFSGNTPWLDGPIVYARDRGPVANRALLAHFPDRRPYLLRDGALLPLPPP